MDGNSSTLLHAEKTQNQDILKVLDYKQFSPITAKIGPVTGG